MANKDNRFKLFNPHFPLHYDDGDNIAVAFAPQSKTSLGDTYLIVTLDLFAGIDLHYTSHVYRTNTLHPAS